MTTNTREKVKAITEQLEQGVKDLFSSDRFAEYLQVMSRFHRYSARNSLLILMQCPDASHVAGFNAWKKDFHRYVKKGEKAISILAPCKRKFTKQIETEDGLEEKEIEYMAYMPVSVFDVSQTEGEDLPTIAKELTGEADAELIDKLTALSPVPVSFEVVTGGAKGYYSHDGKIVINQGMSGQQTAKTMIHEIAHAILHNKTDGAEKDADQRTREVQAESTAYTVCNYLGIDTSDYSFGYVAGWSSGKDAKELQASLEVIRKTAADMIDKISA